MPDQQVKLDPVHSDPAATVLAHAAQVARFNPAALAALSPDQRAAFAGQMKAAGHDPAAVDAAIRPGSVTDEIAKADGVSHRLAIELKAGLDGVPAEQVDLRGIFVGRPESIEAATGLDAGLRQALSGMRLPAAMNRALAEELLKSGDEWTAANVTPAGRQAYLQSQRAIVERVTGKSWGEVLSAAKTVTARIPAAAVKTLAPKGMFERASVLVNLYNQAQRDAARGVK